MKEQTIELRMPLSAKVIVEEVDGGRWEIRCEIYAVDVTTNQFAEFRTRWLGGEPSMEDVATVVANMFNHEFREQLGLEPHAGPDTRCNCDPPPPPDGEHPSQCPRSRVKSA